MMRIRTAFLVLVVAAITSAAAAQPTAAADDASATTWTIAPAAANGPDGRVSLRHVIDPGGVADDFVSVTNFSANAATFDVYASDGIVAASGDFDLLSPGETAQDGGSWVEVLPVPGSTPRPGGGQSVQIAAGATTTFPVHIAVPSGATPGDHPAGIVAELVHDDQSAVHLATRVGTRIHVRVNGDIIPRLDVQIISASFTPSWNPFAPGTLDVTYVVANKGNVRLGADTLVHSSAVAGLVAADANDSWREVLPGQTAKLHTASQVWPMFYVWGDVSATPTVVGEDAIDAPLKASHDPFTTWTMPWAQLIVVALLVGGFFLVRTARRRAKITTQKRIDEAVAAARHAESSEPSAPTVS